MSHRLSNPQPFCAEDTALGEHAQLRMALAEKGLGGYGRQQNLAEVLIAPCIAKGRHDLPEAVHGPTIVALGQVGLAEVVGRQHLEDAIPAGRGAREGALGGGHGLVIHAHDVEMV